MRPRKFSGIGLIAIMVSLLLMLSLVLSYYPLPKIDLALVQMIQGIGSTRTLWLMTLISAPGNLVPAAILVGVAMITVLFSPIKQAVVPLTMVMPADFMSFVLKDLINRPRPSEVLVNVHQFLSDPGFPSSHVVHYTVFFGFLAYLFLKTKLLPKPLRIPLAVSACVLIALIPFSRVYLGAHWPTDVIGGYLLGGSFLLMQIRVYQKLTTY